MSDYRRLVTRLKNTAGAYDYDGWVETAAILEEAADAITELLKAARAMHTWIFLHTADEQAAYDEIGLTNEQNALFGYSGQMILKAEPPKGVEPNGEV